MKSCSSTTAASSSAGRHAELLALGGHYAGMWNRQREAAEARARLIQAEREEAEAEAE